MRLAGVQSPHSDVWTSELPATLSIAYGSVDDHRAMTGGRERR